MIEKGGAYLVLSLAVNCVCVRALPLEDNDVVPDVDLSYLGDRLFKTPSEETGKIVENWNATSEYNPEELGEYAEGDIVFPKKGRNGLIAEASRWKDGVIPYEIKGPYYQDDIDTLNKAFNIYHKYTCLSFRKRLPSDDDYVSIVNTPTGCWSSVGRIGGKQEINLQSPSCTSRIGTPLHELMHAAGFLHEQNRFERDEYVSIAWQNIKRGHENNFDKADKEKTNGFGVPYDFRSVMHYSRKAFSVNGQPTIIPKDPSKAEKMGQREGFSRGDLAKINQMYKCPEKTDQVTGNVSGNAQTGGNKNEPSNPLLEAAGNFLTWLFHRK
ncbi:hatching enzyme 1.2-like [Cylas formicarius]|uniref:hatching enzyme 1.2-like n=1 Tax=Cylas formicarius TaxID=197179 RepID=UPI002958C578|nr:hatching enzyme 1.2-like [Cylas formicarius]